jgi:hypothetical protein
MIKVYLHAKNYGTFLYITVSALFHSILKADTYQLYLIEGVLGITAQAIDVPR